MTAFHYKQATILLLLTLGWLSVGHSRDHTKRVEESPVGMFGNKNLSLDRQLEGLKQCGIEINNGVTSQDLLMFHSKEEMEEAPYKALIETLGYEIEREPYSPISNKLWMCDYERIEDHGAYKDVIERLELMTGNALGFEKITDYVDIEEGKAWVKFTYKGKKIHWDAEVDSDWLDPYILVKYDQLLKASGKGIRIYSNHTDYGQVAFFGAFSNADYRCFKKLSKVTLILLEKQA